MKVTYYCSGPEKADTLWKSVVGNRDAQVLWRETTWMGAVEKDMLLILYVNSIAQVTIRGGNVSPGHCFNL